MERALSLRVIEIPSVTRDESPLELTLPLPMEATQRLIWSL